MTLKGCVSAHKSTHARTHTHALDYNRPPMPLGLRRREANLNTPSGAMLYLTKPRHLNSMSTRFTHTQTPGSKHMYACTHTQVSYIKDKTFLLRPRESNR